jgi:hypothetical protein
LNTNNINKLKNVVSDLTEFRISSIESVREIKILDIQKQFKLAIKKNNYFLDNIKANYEQITKFKDILVRLDKIIKDKIAFFGKNLKNMIGSINPSVDIDIQSDLENFKNCYLSYAKPDIAPRYLFSKNTQLVGEGIRMDLKKIKFYDDDCIEINFKKSKHKIFNDGFILSFYPNDIVRMVRCYNLDKCK